MAELIERHVQIRGRPGFNNRTARGGDENRRDRSGIQALDPHLALASGCRRDVAPVPIFLRRPNMSSSPRGGKSVLEFTADTAMTLVPAIA